MSSTKDVGPKLRQPNRPNLKKKNAIQILRKVPILGELNITIKVCISLKRLLVVTFNIKTVKIQF